MNSPGQLFIDGSRSLLRGAYLPKIEACVDRLTSEDLWWRPHETSNSVGNLLLHLSGNLRQWLVSGVGGAPDVRERQSEFDARTPIAGGELLGRLADTLREADEVLASLDPQRLTDRALIQGRDTTVLEAIYHAVEHCSMHTGQIILITKMRTGAGLGFYELVDGIPVPRWPGTEERMQE